MESTRHKETTTRQKASAFHPLLFACYPALFLYARNTGEATPGDLGRTLLVLVAGTILLWLAGRVVLRDWQKAALAASLIVFATCSFGYVVDPLRDLTIGNFRVGRTLVLGPPVCLLVGYGLYRIVRARSVRAATAFANWMGSLLVAGALLQTAANLYGPDSVDASRWRSFVGQRAASQQIRAPEQPPSVYYIILDEYTRSDVLKDDMGLDNSGFLRDLERRGFRIGYKSVSNYNMTPASLASSLNMDYLQTLQRSAKLRRLNKRSLREMVAGSVLLRMLRQQGYSVVLYPSDYGITESIRDADRTYRRSAFSLSEFERTIIRQSLPAPLLLPPTVHRGELLYNLDRLGRPEGVKGPVFVFAHIISPHGPYVFDRKGNMPPQDTLGLETRMTRQVVRRYTDQIVYTNKRILEAVDRILEAEQTPPIIILQGDHGFRLFPEGHPARERAMFGILNAWHLPTGFREAPAPAVSPVNTFRMILNEYFGGRFGLLPDVSYESRLDASGFTPGSARGSSLP